MAVTLAQLEAFVAVARAGTFTRAAEQLYVTQSAVTQQVKNLQELLGVPLFDIVGRRPVLTDAGRFLAERALEIGGAVAALERDMREFAAARSGTLDLGATVTIGNYALPPLLKAFRDRVPDCRLRLTIENTAAVLAALRAGELALALVEGAVEDVDFDVRPYASDELVLIVPRAGHAFSARRRVSLREVRDEALVLRERGSGTRTLVDEALGLAPSGGASLVFSSNEGIVRAVESGLGVALISRMCVDRDAELQRVRVVALREGPLVRTLRLVRARARTPSPLAKRFADFVLATGATQERVKTVST